MSELSYAREQEVGVMEDEMEAEVEIRSGLRPTHELKVKDPETNRHTTIGVAWDSDGFMNIQLSPAASISYADQQNLGLKLTIFPIDKYREES